MPHPIAVDHTRRWVVDMQENADSLEEARTKPHVLADTDVERVKRVYTGRLSLCQFVGAGAGLLLLGAQSDAEQGAGFVDLAQRLQDGVDGLGDGGRRSGGSPWQDHVISCHFS
jgi:hypothetical protein